MKKLSNKSLEELLEFENKNKVLSFSEFQYTKNRIKGELIVSLEYFRGNKLIDIYQLLNNDYQKYRRSLPIYQTIYTLYHKILNDLVLEIKNSSIEKDPLSLSILLGDYLIPMGFISYTPTFHKTNSEKLISLDEEYSCASYLDGAYILAGYGCCRHVVSFVSHILSKLKISNDIITCIEVVQEDSSFQILENMMITHAILGYVMNGRYFLEDIHNHIYNSYIDPNYIETGTNDKWILDYTSTNLFQPNLYWNPNLNYSTITEEEVLKKQEQIGSTLQEGEIEQFIAFKQKHFDTYEKLAFLVPLELERTTEKEQQKIKRI